MEGIPLTAGTKGQDVNANLCAWNAVAVNLTADTTLRALRGIYVGGTGSVKVDLIEGGVGVVFTAVPVGTILPVQVSKIYSTANGTTATNLVALLA